MPLPTITDEQREMAVAMLANALRKQDRRPTAAAGSDPLFPEVGSGRAQHTADARYVQGMRDLLAVLFAGGRLTSHLCHQEALDLAAGRTPE